MRYLGSFSDGVELLQFSLERRIIRTRFRSVRIPSSGGVVRHGGTLSDSVGEELSVREMSRSQHATSWKEKGEQEFRRHFGVRF